MSLLLLLLLLLLLSLFVLHKQRNKEMKTQRLQIQISHSVFHMIRTTLESMAWKFFSRIGALLEELGDKK